MIVGVSLRHDHHDVASCINYTIPETKKDLSNLPSHYKLRSLSRPLSRVIRLGIRVISAGQLVLPHSPARTKYYDIYYDFIYIMRVPFCAAQD